MCSVRCLGGVPPFAESAVCVVPQMIALGRGHSKLQGYKVAHPKTVARGAPPTPERLDNSQIGG